MSDFRVKIPALREFARYITDEADQVPQSRDVVGYPQFGHSAHWGARTMWESHQSAWKTMQPLLDEIKGGALSSEAAVQEVIENYVATDDTARQRMDAVNKAVSDMRPEPSGGGQQGHGQGQRGHGQSPSGSSGRAADPEGAADDQPPYPPGGLPGPSPA